MAAAAPPFVDMMTSKPAWQTILLNFELVGRACDRLVKDYSTASDLMASNVDQIKCVVYHQNITSRSHSTENQCCYVDTPQLNRIIAFQVWLYYNPTKYSIGGKYSYFLWDKLVPGEISDASFISHTHRKCRDPSHIFGEEETITIKEYRDYVWPAVENNSH